jgi:hypothetical protein
MRARPNVGIAWFAVSRLSAGLPRRSGHHPSKGVGKTHDINGHNWAIVPPSLDGRGFTQADVTLVRPLCKEIIGSGLRSGELGAHVP